MPNDLPVLEGECRATINTVGLEPSVGFLHEMSDYQRSSRLCDLQVPFSWIAKQQIRPLEGLQLD